MGEKVGHTWRENEGTVNPHIIFDPYRGLRIGWNCPTCGKPTQIDGYEINMRNVCTCGTVVRAGLDVTLREVPSNA